jgi:MFS family permease
VTVRSAANMTEGLQSANSKSKRDDADRSILGPKAHLALFSWCQILVYFDRGVVAGMLDYITKEVEGVESNLRAGLLAGMFMIGYMIASPLFVRLSQNSRSWTVYAIIIGLVVLAVSAIATYFAWNSFPALLMMRLVSGTGEAAFCSLAPAIIDDAAPTGKKSLYVGLYFTFLYVGYGLGTAACFPFTSWETGKLLFLAEAAMIVPLVAVFAYLRNRFAVPENIQEQTRASSEGGSLVSQLKVVMRQKTFLLFSLGYGAYFFAFGAFAFWTPLVMAHIYPDQQSVAAIGFGGVTIVTGIVGTAMGGYIMDVVCHRLASKESFRNHPHDTIRVLSGSIICTTLVLGGMLFTFPAAFAPNIYIFLVFFAAGTLLLFSITAPVNIAIMYSVPSALKAQAMAVSVGISHVVGDFPSPFVVGGIIDLTNHKTAMLCTSGVLAVSAILWGLGGRSAKEQGDDAAVSSEEFTKPTVLTQSEQIEAVSRI